MSGEEQAPRPFGHGQPGAGFVLCSAKPLSLEAVFQRLRQMAPPNATCVLAELDGRRYFVNFTLTPLAYTEIPAKP